MSTETILAALTAEALDENDPGRHVGRASTTLIAVTVSVGMSVVGVLAAGSPVATMYAVTVFG
ncbi:hypothetical protein [Streptomyces sp. WMMC905]|uniref:hypothetical protein n=1 Tax=Streptomyces sp. WMMC905 TaxID=3404123 RepID=UPI003B925AF0